MKVRVPSRIAATFASVLLLAHCAQVPVRDDTGRVPMSDRQEVQMGAQAHLAVLKEYARLEQPALQAYVDGVGLQVARQSPRAGLQWHFTVLDSADVNAFSLPGGYVYLTRGILAYLNSEAQLAAVIAHEVGHVSARHGVHQLGTPAAATLESVLEPEAENPTVASMLQRLAPAWASGYGREQEAEAGRLGAGYLAGAGYPPQAMVDTLRALKNQAAAGVSPRGARPPHPYHATFDAGPDDAPLAQAVARANRDAAATPREGRDDYLQRLAGIDFGDSPDQGVLRNNLLLHERLGLAIQFPPGWQVHNRADRVVATNPAGDALLELQAGPKRGRPLDTLQKGVKLDAGARFDSGSLGGLPAAFAAGSQAGRPMVVAAVVLDGAQYLIAGMTRDKSAYERERSALRAAINSFHAITPAEKKSARTYSLQLTPSRPGQTLADLARQSPLGAGAELQLRLINGLYPSGEPKPGELVKIVQ